VPPGAIEGHRPPKLALLGVCAGLVLQCLEAETQVLDARGGRRITPLGQKQGAFHEEIGETGVYCEQSFSGGPAQLPVNDVLPLVCSAAGWFDAHAVIRVLIRCTMAVSIGSGRRAPAGGRLPPALHSHPAPVTPCGGQQRRSS